MIYLYPSILAVYIVLGTFSAELQSEKTNAYKNKTTQTSLTGFVKKIFLFLKISLQEPPFHFFFSPAWFKTVSMKSILRLKL